jgi:hypothetical protein
MVCRDFFDNDYMEREFDKLLSSLFLYLFFYDEDYDDKIFKIMETIKEKLKQGLSEEESEKTANCLYDLYCEYVSMLKKETRRKRDGV